MNKLNSVTLKVLRLQYKELRSRQCSVQLRSPLCTHTVCLDWKIAWRLTRNSRCSVFILLLPFNLVSLRATLSQCSCSFLCCRVSPTGWTGFSLFIYFHVVFALICLRVPPLHAHTALSVMGFSTQCNCHGFAAECKYLHVRCLCVSNYFVPSIFQ